jgi:hypothetical protein
VAASEVLASALALLFAVIVLLRWERERANVDDVRHVNGLRFVLELATWSLSQRDMLERDGTS